MFRLISPSSTTMTRICNGQFHYHRWFFCCLQVNNSQNLSLLLKNSAYLTRFSVWMKQSLWSDHHEPIWAPFVHNKRDNPWYLTIMGQCPVSWHQTICLLTPERHRQRPHSQGMEINCLNKNLHLDTLGNRCPEHTLQVTLIDLYLIHCYDQRKACINNVYWEESPKISAIQGVPKKTVFSVWQTIEGTRSGL